MSDESGSDDRPDVVSAIDDSTLTPGQIEELQGHSSVERAIHTETASDINEITGFVVDLGDTCHAVRYEDGAWRVIKTADELGDVLAAFDD